MDKLQLRIDRHQAETVLNALEVTAKSAPGTPAAAECQELWAWLTHRYTRAWGLPPRVADAARAARSAGRQ